MNISRSIKQTLWLLPAVLCFLLSLPAAANQIRLQVSPGHPVLLADRQQTTWIKIGLEGLPLPTAGKRTPLNVAIVLDRSGSMSGEKLQRAKEAAVMALDHFTPDDIVSVLAYSSTVDVLVPATRASEKSAITSAIRGIRASGNTALFAGVAKGAAEVRKFLDDYHVNRVILLSDGLANVGPDTPGELGRFGSQLGGEGISVTTIGLGLGYNEDLMVNLAGNSDGNHAFVENAVDLARIFRSEFGDLGSVVAQDIEIIIHCPDGVRPLRVLGREAEIYGDKAVVKLNQLYANQEKYLTLEVDVPSSGEGDERLLASVDAKWNDMGMKKRATQKDSARVRFSPSQQEIEASTVKEVLVSVTEQIAVEKTKEAVELRDAGKVEEAKEVLQESAALLEAEGVKYQSPRLLKQSEEKRKAEGSLGGAEWNRARKKLRSDQYSIENQQSYQ